MARPKELTPEVQNIICTEVKKGVPYEIAAWKADRSDRILYIWKKQGGADYNDGVDSPEAAFFQALKRAEADYVSECMDVVNRGKLDWTARMTVLERRHRKYFGKEAPKEEEENKDKDTPALNNPLEVFNRVAQLPEYVLEAALKKKRESNGNA